MVHRRKLVAPLAGLGPIMRTGLALAFLFACAAPQAARAEEEKVLNLYIWSDYLGPNTLAEFTRRTGIKVNYDVYDSNEILEAKLMVGKSGYDVVIPTALPYFAKQVKAGLYRKLDLAGIPNAAGIDERVLARLKMADPGNIYGVPYLLSATGVGFVRSKISPLLPNAPFGSLALLFESKVTTALKPCGITILDAPDEVFPAALAYLGKSPVSTSEEDLKAAASLVSAARPAYRYIHSSNYINDLANGAICVAHGWLGDLFQARKRAREANNGVEIEIFLPREGASVNVDVIAIPKDAPHPENAQKFINYILDPQVAAEITAAVGYANAIPASRSLLPKAIAEDPVVYPPASVNLYMPPPVIQKYERERNRLWTRVKTGR